MLAWVVAGVTAAIGVAVAWYYRSLALRTQDLGLALNDTLVKLNAQLAELKTRADLDNQVDTNAAQNVHGADAASEWLNSSGLSTGARQGAVSKVRAAVGRKPSTFVNGFVRGTGYHDAG